MRELLTLAHFLPLLQQPFHLRLEDLALELDLVVADALEPHAGLRGTPFALVFRGPMQPILPQRLYPLHHHALGAVDIFLVPIGPDDVGQRYEAVFN
jgi:hypothetical protein